MLVFALDRKESMMDIRRRFRHYIFTRNSGMCVLLSAVLAVFLPAWAASSEAELARPYATPSVSNRPRVVGFAEGQKPIAPVGFQVGIFAEHLRNPRWIYVLPTGDVLVAESSANRISLFRDTNCDGIPDEHEVFLDQLNRPFGMALSGEHFYVANTDGVLVFPYRKGQTQIEGTGKKIVDLPALGYNNHWTRNLLIDPSERKLYITVGSGTNVDTEGVDVQDPRRAAISVANLDGSDFRVYASGLRNPIGLAFEPTKHWLWTVVNERDGLGDDLVPDYLTHVQSGAFYGWPYSYFGQNEDPRHKGEHPELVSRAIVPDLALGSHVAALGLAFYEDRVFPAHYSGGAFIGEHGSWNRSSRVGYKVVFVPFKNGMPAGPIEDFLTGFMKSPDDKDVYGRPVGVAVAKDGSLLVADDGAGKIWRVSCLERNHR